MALGKLHRRRDFDLKAHRPPTQLIDVSCAGRGAQLLHSLRDNTTPADSWFFLSWIPHSPNFKHPLHEFP